MTPRGSVGSSAISFRLAAISAVMSRCAALGQCARASSVSAVVSARDSAAAFERSRAARVAAAGFSI